VNEEIREADAILLLYDISRADTVARLQSFWLPRIKRISERVPIILVANKNDLQEDASKANLVEMHKIHKVIKPLVKEFKVT
jgi:Ras family protein T1